ARTGDRAVRTAPHARLPAVLVVPRPPAALHEPVVAARRTGRPDRRVGRVVEPGAAVPAHAFGPVRGADRGGAQEGRGRQLLLHGQVRHLPAEGRRTRPQGDLRAVAVRLPAVRHPRGGPVPGGGGPLILGPGGRGLARVSPDSRGGRC